MKTNFKFKMATAIVIALLVSVVAIGGGPTDRPAPCGAGGWVYEEATRMATFTIWPTDWQNKKFGTPTTVRGVKGWFKVPRTPGMQDVKNITNLDSASPGEGADLDIVSIYQDPLTGELTLEGMFSRLEQCLGQGHVRVPDLYANTNGDNELGEGDMLYSVVNIDVWLTVAPSFSLNDAFTIVNGEVPGLPGMKFSTTEFTWDPMTGLNGTPFTGDALVESLHELWVPEPATIVLLALGGLALLRKRRS